MEDKTKLNDASQIIADARVKLLELGVNPNELVQLLLDEAVLGLIVSGHDLDDISRFFKRYYKRDMPKLYKRITHIVDNYN
ncbi:hypothetical protein [Roseibium sp. RKSG952]|uniref:hypothetical protein n=1 Tax=Roseibium sp. RKSG952 TaxID=2529384 RepID=UPI0012BC67EA|nr:hypothetical protein [Roseibium sp. RKSG952]MTH95371.1 hypothetical protein [Roseibium sp. RKSG952]